MPGWQLNCLNERNKLEILQIRADRVRCRLNLQAACLTLSSVHTLQWSQALLVLFEHKHRLWPSSTVLSPCSDSRICTEPGLTCYCEKKLHLHHRRLFLNAQKACEVTKMQLECWQLTYQFPTDIGQFPSPWICACLSFFLSASVLSGSLKRWWMDFMELLEGWALAQGAFSSYPGNRHLLALLNVIISKLIYLPSPASPFSHPATPTPPTRACLNLCAIQIL